MPSPIIIDTTPPSTVTLTADQSSVTVNPGIGIVGPDDGFGIDATAGAGGSIFVYGSLSAGGGIYDPSTTRDSYNIVVYAQASITATTGYGIALQKKATVINHGHIDAMQFGISMGDGNSVVLNNGSIEAKTGIQAYGHETIVENSGSIVTTGNGIVAIGNNYTITNSGFIQAGSHGIILADTAGVATVVTNTGTLGGTVLAFRGSAFDNEFINRGAVIGNIDLRAGNDFVDSRQGTVTGKIILGTGNDTALGGAANDVFWDGLGSDSIDAGDGIDTLSYESSVDAAAPVHVDLGLTTAQTSLWGTDTFVNFENVIGGAAADTITGSNGGNLLKGLTGSDSLSGAGGNDTLEGGADNDVLDGGDGLDTAVYDGAVIVTVDLRLETVQDTGAGNDVLTGIENLVGGSAGDRLTGNDVDNILVGKGGADLLSGDAGTDRLEGGAGNDVLDGGSGADTAVFSGTRDSYTIVANADGTVTVTDARPEGDGKDVLRNVETLTFGDLSLAAPIYAAPSPVPSPTPSPAPSPAPSAPSGSAALALHGTSKADHLTGGNSADWLWGRLGADVLTGGTGRDIFVFDTNPKAKKNTDKITDFVVKDDTIYLENKYFKIGSKGTLKKPAALSSKMFYVGAKAHDKDDRIVYDKKKGALYYDDDGNGAHKAVAFAILKKGLKMTYHDFFTI
ncbi:calcium-binding protein [Microvirga sp. 17 mud 1-3]|uniref:calcium-binding protein n=1 Tax=Microvirga sp. 17 mud 1-3 TaxID=2082949 RepID=UPI0013A5B8B6|nr:calcium-binding protein [Microvirga sp. 17 mud 1-3]